MSLVERVTVLDEAGDLSPANPDPWMVIAALTVPRLRDLELAVRHVRKHLSPHLRATPEFKFHGASEKLRQRLLQRLARLETLEIDLTLASQRRLSPEFSPDEHYFAAVAETVQRLRQRHPQLRLVLDKRYAKRATQDALTAVIRYAGRMQVGRLEIEHKDSQTLAALQAADFVAGAFFQREARHIDAYAQILQLRVVSEVWYAQ